MSKASEILDQIDDYPIFEMANLFRDETGLSYVVHIRTKLETPSHHHTPTLKVYQSGPIDSENFSLIISDDPNIPNSMKNNKFYKSIKSKDLELIKKWIKINKDRLLDFYNNGLSWNIDKIHSWSKTLERV